MSAERISMFILRYEAQALWVYLLISISRGLFLIPSTPFVLAGAILFPHQPYLVMSISLLGVVGGATFIYYFSDLLNFSERLEKKYPKQLQLWKKRLNSPKATLFVMAWSFFPFVPTDLICYVAGIVKMRYIYLISGVFLGELVLIYCYVHLGAGLIELILG